jgi:hypothetical protein
MAAVATVTIKQIINSHSKSCIFPPAYAIVHSSRRFHHGQTGMTRSASLQPATGSFASHTPSLTAPDATDRQFESRQVETAVCRSGKAFLIPWPRGAP